MRGLVRDLHRANPSIYWTDLLLTAAVGWGAFITAVVLRPFSFGMIAAAFVSVLALYRGLCFMHEVSHQNQRTLPGFEAIWNLLVGFPMLMPSFVYVGVHQNHHKLSTYGTAGDPEYLPFAHSSRMTTLFALESFLIPVVLVIRFLLLTPIGLLFPRFQKWLVVYASSLTMNVQYRREASPDLLRKIRRDSALALLLWGSAGALAGAGLLPWRIFPIWLAIVSVASFINTLRTLGAHEYESTGEPLDRMGQLTDSIDTPGGFWTELWAPVGLRYHALHHYFPGVPYHNLPEAYRRVMGSMPVAESYGQMSSESLPHSLSRLYAKGLRKLM